MNENQGELSRLKDIVNMSVDRKYDNNLLTDVPAAFIELGKITGVLQSSDLILIAGRPSMGKTTVCLNIAAHTAIETNKPVFIFSLDMSKEMLAWKLLCDIAEVEQVSKINFLTEAQRRKLAMAKNFLSETEIYIDDTPLTSCTEIKVKVRDLKGSLKSNPGLIIVDYLQLIPGKDDSENIKLRLKENVRELKSIAKEFEAPLILTSQLTRHVDQRSDKRPRLEDLRIMSEIEEYCDAVMFIYRDAVYDRSRNNPEKGTAELIIAKSKNGRTGTIKLPFFESTKTSST